MTETGILMLEGTPNMPALLLTYFYDVAGNVTDATIATVPPQTTPPTLPTTVASYHQDFDELGRLKLFTAPTATNYGDINVNAQFDAAGNLTDLKRGMTGVSGGPALQNPLVSHYAYDSAERLAQLTHVQGVNTTGFATQQSNLEQYTFSYDGDDRAFSINRSGDGSTIGAMAYYAYDADGQLLASDRSGTAHDEGFTYDDTGNRITANGSTYGYAGGQNQNQVQSDGVSSYLYDNEGNLLRKTPNSGVSSSNPVVVYGYDQRNRLVSVKNYDSVAHADAGGTTGLVMSAAYAYDVFNQRLSKTINGATTDKYVYDGGHIALQYTVSSGSDILSHRYVHPQALDMVLGDERFSGGGSSTLLWTLADQEGSIRDVVRMTGPSTVPNHITYDAYGVATNSSGLATVHTIYAYAGGIYDAETGLQENGRRYYDPHLGRFITTDPAGADINLYRYAGNDPVNAVDPSGLMTALAGQAVSTVSNWASSAWSSYTALAARAQANSSWIEDDSDFYPQGLGGPLGQMVQQARSQSSTWNSTAVTPTSGLRFSDIVVSPYALEDAQSAAQARYDQTQAKIAQLKDDLAHLGDDSWGVYDDAKDLQLRAQINALEHGGVKSVSSTTRLWDEYDKWVDENVRDGGVGDPSPKGALWVAGSLASIFFPDSVPSHLVEYNDGSRILWDGGGPSNRDLFVEGLALGTPLFGAAAKVEDAALKAGSNATRNVGGFGKLTGFSQSEAQMIRSAEQALQLAGYDTSMASEVLRTSSFPAGTRGMTLGSDTVVLGREAFSSQAMTNHVLEEEIIHLQQKAAGMATEFGPGTAQSLEEAANAARKFQKPNE